MMEFLEERIGELIRQIGELRYGAVQEIGEWNYCCGNGLLPGVRLDRLGEGLLGGECPEGKADEFLTGVQTEGGPEVFRKGAYWGNGRKYYGFWQTVRVGAALDGQQLQFSLATGREGEWDATNPQFLLYVDGEIRQGMDVNHRDSLLGTRRAGDEIRLGLLAYAGEEPGDLRFDTCLRVIYPEIEEYYYDLLIPYQTACLLDKNDKDYCNILKHLDAAVNLLDLRRPGSPEFWAGLRASAAYFRQEFYGKTCGKLPEAEIYCVGHTHIDVAWLWTLAVTRQKAVRSFATVVRLMEQYPEYIFMSSQPQLYQYVKEDAPELYEKIKKLVWEGRWEVEGGMWLEADCNIPSGESLVRQFLYGKRFFREEFGKDSRILWLPDVFGYSAALPQIMEQSGISYFMTTKISWNDTNKLPYDTFYWEGIDGTRVLTHFITARDYDSVTRGTQASSSEYHTAFSTNYNGYACPSQVKGGWQRYQQKDLNEEILLAYGYGDGGGGTTDWMIESAKRMEKGIPGMPRTKFSTAGEFFRVLERKVSEKPECPVWSGELYLENHRATYTSMARNKRSNRKCEFMLENAEFLSVLAAGGLSGAEKAGLSGAETAGLAGAGNGRTGDEGGINTPVWPEGYEKERFDAGWRTLLKNQFHDILPGSAIEEVYEDSKREYEALEAEFLPLTARLAQRLADESAGAAGDLFVVNYNGTAGSGLVPVPKEGWEAVKALKIPVQEAADGSRLISVKDIPGKSYERLEAGSPYLCGTDISAEPGAGDCGEGPGMVCFCEACVENAYYRILLNEAGQMTSFYDKEEERELLQPGRRGNVFMTYEDKPHRYDNWNLYDYHREKSWEADEVTDRRILEQGPLRYCLQYTYRYLSSVICEKLYFYPDRRQIDMEIDIDWREDQIFLKLLYPVQLYSRQAAFEIQYGNVTRNMVRNTSWDCARFEVCCHKWMDISEGNGYGVSFLNDCKFGVSVEENEVGLSLIKSGLYPNPHADREHHHILYSVYPHRGDWRMAGTVARAYALNNPMELVCKQKEGGSRTAGPLACVDAENVILETIKPAEDGRGWIARLYEAYGQRTRTELSVRTGCGGLYRTNLLEQEEEALAMQNGSCRLQLRPYEILTLRIV